MGGPENAWFIVENPIINLWYKIDEKEGYPHFRTSPYIEGSLFYCSKFPSQLPRGPCDPPEGPSRGPPCRRSLGLWEVAAWRCASQKLVLGCACCWSRPRPNHKTWGKLSKVATNHWLTNIFLGYWWWSMGTIIFLFNRRHGIVMGYLNGFLENDGIILGLCVEMYGIIMGWTLVLALVVIASHGHYSYHKA